MKRTRAVKRLILVAVYGLFLLALFEGGARVFWKTRGVPFLSTSRKIHYSFYPGVAKVERELRAAIRREPDCFDVLMLGGSALNLRYGAVEHVLRERLTRETGKCVRIHNLAEPGHTSLDSFYKYKHLSGSHFDLVIVYHGINDVRANNCPASVFQPDYSHLSWYKLINDFERRSDARWLTFPYTIKFVALKAADRLGWLGTLPTHRPDEDSVDFGCDVKSVASFRKNLGGIVNMARVRGEPVLLMTFAHYLPDGYSEDAFKARSLDYTTHLLAVELWGKPECVVAGIAAHNAVVIELASGSDGTLFVDQERLMPDEGTYFNDVCHFTHEGGRRFVDNLLDAVRPLM